MGVGCADSVAARQFAHFSSMIAASQQFAVFLKAQIHWPRPKRLAHRNLHHE
jgi:hypothetical protein